MSDITAASEATMFQLNLQTKIDNLERIVHDQNQTLNQVLTALTRFSGLLESNHRTNEERPYKTNNLHAFVPKLTILLREDEAKRLERFPRNDFIAIFKNMGHPYSDIVAYDIRPGHRLDLYIPDPTICERLSGTQCMAIISGRLGLRPNPASKVEKYWVNVETSFLPNQVKKGHKDNLEDWKKTSGLAIQETRYASSKLLFAFDTIQAAKKACERIFVISAAIAWARPIDIRAIGQFCSTCGGMGHYFRQCEKKNLPAEKKNLCWQCAQPRHDAGDHCERPRRCINCGEGHATTSELCQEPNTVRHRSRCKELAKEKPWWAVKLDLPDFPILELLSEEDKRTRKKKSNTESATERALDFTNPIHGGYVNAAASVRAASQVPGPNTMGNSAAASIDVDGTSMPKAARRSDDPIAPPFHPIFLRTDRNRASVARNPPDQVPQKRGHGPSVDWTEEDSRRSGSTSKKVNVAGGTFGDNPESDNLQRLQQFPSVAPSHADALNDNRQDNSNDNATAHVKEESIIEKNGR